MAFEEILIEGYLGHDPSRPSQSKPNLVTFSVGVSQFTKNKETGEWDSKTTWYKVESWAESKAYLYQTLKKGDKVVVRGRPSINLWKSKDTGEQRAAIVIDLDDISLPKSLETREEGIISKQEEVKPKTKIPSNATPKEVQKENPHQGHMAEFHDEQAERHQDLDDDIPF